jgi:cyclophilin family peptidyl-prolyl cis-trans isomerase
MTLNLDHDYQAVIVTERGDITVDLFQETTPKTVNNFVFLARQGFYDGVTFHRVLDRFMAQAGDPTGRGAGGPGYRFADEALDRARFDRPGLLAMANAGPNTNGSQFFITFVPTPHLNGRHTVFGEVVQGIDVLDKLTRRNPQVNPSAPGDQILRIDVLESQ